MLKVVLFNLALFSVLNWPLDAVGVAVDSGEPCTTRLLQNLWRQHRGILPGSQ